MRTAFAMFCLVFIDLHFGKGGSLIESGLMMVGIGLCMFQDWIDILKGWKEVK